MLITVLIPDHSRVSPNAQARSRSVYIILSRTPRAHASRSCVCVCVCVCGCVFYVPQVLRGQHGLATARGGANLGLWRSSQRSLCAASLLHCDEAKSRVLQVRRALSKRLAKMTKYVTKNFTKSFWKLVISEIYRLYSSLTNLYPSDNKNLFCTCQLFLISSLFDYITKTFIKCLKHT